MNHKNEILVLISIISAIFIAFFTSYAILAIIPGVFLFSQRIKYGALIGFLESFLSFMGIYLEYPLGYVSRLSTIIGGIIGFPSFLIVILYPLIAGIITLFSAILFISIGSMFLNQGKEKISNKGN
ncbi:hypothetical protein ACNF40_06900 [Cuniculiplasma sp. SKW4]|uniref:hypothetical protein n=1 Tax=Cuniculiplasma sp. SKW4 TaxID=3400171 RepID=UPI003FD46502